MVGSFLMIANKVRLIGAIWSGRLLERRSILQAKEFCLKSNFNKTANVPKILSQMMNVPPGARKNHVIDDLSHISKGERR